MRRRRVRVFVSVVLAMSVGLPAGATAATAPDTPPADPGSLAVESARLVTLVTGDVIRVSGTGKDLKATVEVDAGPVGDVSIARMNKTVYALPGVAGPMIASGALDLRLFDVTALLDVAEHSPLSGLADAGAGTTAMTKLPLIVQYAPGARRMAAAGGGPALSSINAQAMEIAKQDTAGFWSQLKGTASQRLAPGITKVWLDGVVKRELDVSRKTIGAERAWSDGYDGTGVRVAVLDTGIDTNHPDLADRVVLEKSFVPGEPPIDGNLHGTHVSSIIAGSGVASQGRYTGVAPGARLLNGKVLSNDGYGSDSQLIEGMQWAASNGADVVNMSIGSAPSDGKGPLDQAVDSISDQYDVLFVVAAGNDYNTPESVNSPGAASRALTVANVHKDGSVVDISSSVGPRLGDHALKPEISAPGTDITAAYMGTSDYVSLTGTSMASPHVAASAAIVVQKHPDWSAQQVKDALMAAAVPEGHDPLYWQGSGVVRADRAVEASVTATGKFDLGPVRYPQPDGTTVSGTATYRNLTGSPVTLQLAASFEQAPAGFQRDATPFTPPAGSVDVPASVVVPANGSAEVPVRVDVSKMPYATIFGRLVATAAGEQVASTLVSWTRETEMHQLKIRAIDRAGDQLTSTAWSVLWLAGLDDESVHPVLFNNGVGTVQGRGTDPWLEAGRRYALMGYIGGFGPGPRYPLTSWTFVSEPEFVMDRDHTFSFDARLAGRVEFKTPRYTAGGTGESWLQRTWAGNEFSVQPGSGSGGTVSRMADEIYTLQGGKATTGTFEWKNFTARQAPPFAFHVPGQATPVMGRLPAQIDGVRLLPGDRQRLVDVGAGTAPDTSAPGLRGALAVWHPPSDWDGFIRGASDEVATAGARGLVVVPPPDLLWASRGPQPEWPDNGQVPIAVVKHSDAAGLLAAARNGQSVQLDSGHPSPYAYFLVSRQRGGLTDGQLVRPREQDLVRRDVRYHGDPALFCGHTVVADRGAGLTRMIFDSSTPDTGHYCGVTRQEFFSPDVFFEVYRDSPGLAYWPPSNPTARWPVSELSRVEAPAGDRRTVDIGSGPTVPGYGNQWLFWPYRPWAVSTRLSGVAAFGFSPGWFTSGPDESNFLNEYTSEFSTTARLFRADGSLVCESPFGLSNDRCLGTTAGRYRLTLDVDQDRLPLSRKTRTTWNFTMIEQQEQGNNPVQPVMMLDWDLDTDLQSVISAKAPTHVEVTPYFAKGGPVYRGHFRGELSVSYDDGATWRKAGTDGAGARDALRFLVPAPRGTTSGYASYRVSVTDDDGNTVDQQVIKAAYAPAG